MFLHFSPLFTPPTNPSPRTSDGGYLQAGTANSFSLTALLSRTPFRAIVVIPAYRLNLFGFLASRELAADAASHHDPATAGNYGLWDQRLALTWTHENISYFSGDASNLTIGGYSAGAHSAFHQLSHDLLRAAPSHRLVRRAVMWSNGPGMSPRTVPQSQSQFDALVAACHIPASLPSAEKLARLRALPYPTLLAAAATLSLSEFRATDDEDFIPARLFPRIQSGEYAAAMRERGIKLVAGECANEHLSYRRYRPPRADGGLSALQKRLEADYPPAPVAALLKRHYSAADAHMPDLAHWRPRARTWPDAFGHVYADLQVHALQRGFVACLGRELVRRYRIEWRSGAAETPERHGATHSSDLAIWFFGNGREVGEGDAEVIGEFAGPVWRFVMGEEIGEGEWGTKGIKEVRVLDKNGRVGVVRDDDWERSGEVWRIMGEAQRQEREKREGRSRL